MTSPSAAQHRTLSALSTAPSAPPSHLISDLSSAAPTRSHSVSDFSKRVSRRTEPAEHRQEFTYDQEVEEVEADAKLSAAEPRVVRRSISFKEITVASGGEANPEAEVNRLLVQSTDKDIRRLVRSDSRSVRTTSVKYLSNLKERPMPHDIKDIIAEQKRLERRQAKQEKRDRKNREKLFKEVMETYKKEIESTVSKIADQSWWSVYEYMWNEVFASTNSQPADERHRELAGQTHIVSACCDLIKDFLRKFGRLVMAHELTRTGREVWNEFAELERENREKRIRMELEIEAAKRRGKRKNHTKEKTRTTSKRTTSSLTSARLRSGGGSSGSMGSTSSGTSSSYGPPLSSPTITPTSSTVSQPMARLSAQLEERVDKLLASDSESDGEPENAVPENEATTMSSVSTTSTSHRHCPPHIDGMTDTLASAVSTMSTRSAMSSMGSVPSIVLNL